MVIYHQNLIKYDFYWFIPWIIKMAELDRFDRLILEALQHNARLSGAELARRVNLSAPAVAERMAKLERNGVIRGYQAVLDPAQLGYPIQCLIELTLYRADYPHAQATLAGFPELIDCHRVTGDACMVLKAAVSSMAHLQALIERLTELGGTKTAIILSSPFTGRVPPWPVEGAST